jgi:hypothetical protein
MSFSAIVEASGCLFAHGAKIETAYKWDTHLSDHHNALQARNACAAALAHDVDGVVIELPKGSGATIGSLASMVRIVLVSILMVETGRSETAVRVEIPTTSWRMRIGGQVVYPLSFGPCYGSDSSRFTFGEHGAYILLQPASAFTRRHERTAGRISDRARASIRERHQAEGRAYDLRLTLSPFECHKVVKPLHLDSHPVVWW